jgi:hypothetical protein
MEIAVAHKSQDTQVLIIKANCHLRWGLFVLSAVLFLAAIAMVFFVPPGSAFDWSVQLPFTSAKITQGSVAIGFATIAMVLALAALFKKG